MTRKRRRLLMVGAGLACVAVATGLALSAFDDGLVFFYSPSDLAANRPAPDRLVRIGGLVEDGSVVRGTGREVAFVVTDLAATVPVRYDGSLPDLFREGQGVVVEGRYGTDGTFQAVEVLAKHDETYMPPEVAESLQRAGVWKPGRDGKAAQ